MNAAYVSNRNSGFCNFDCTCLKFFQKKYIYIYVQANTDEDVSEIGKFCTDYTF